MTYNNDKGLDDRIEASGLLAAVAVHREQSQTSMARGANTLSRLVWDVNESYTHPTVVQNVWDVRSTKADSVMTASRPGRLRNNGTAATQSLALTDVIHRRSKFTALTHISVELSLSIWLK
jgi:hypothetical protein